MINDQLRVGQKTPVTLTELEEALVKLFKPSGNHAPETALLFFSGHGLRKDRGIQEGFLACSDVNPSQGFYGLSLQWLRRLLQESPIRQQIVWLDCCYSGELLNYAEADPGNRGEGRSLFLMAASREFEPAFEDVSGQHSVLTAALLKGLDPRRQTDGVVTDSTLIEVVAQELHGTTQRPLWMKPSGEILLTGERQAMLTQNLSGVCPYRGLNYFDTGDADYFHGRKDLTDQLLDPLKIGKGNFLAVLGASGSGKSSVVRAGVIHQLQQNCLSGSKHWKICMMTPGERPLESLATAFLEADRTDLARARDLKQAEEAIAEGSTGFARFIRASQSPRILVFVDQFEEVFTLCQNATERQQFIACLLKALEQTGDKLCLVLAMRADFLGKCTEQDYSGLAAKIQSHLVTVKPMTRKELEEAIRKPAEQVGLNVEDTLVTQILKDLGLDEADSPAEARQWEPGSLPLLEYTLEQLWRYRTLDRLTLDRYIRLGGVQETLEKKADEVYQSFSLEEQHVAKRIFLELTQLGEGTEDTRRRVLKQDLSSVNQSAALVDRVIQKLADPAFRLVVTSELVEKGQRSGRFVIIDVAHEALIRHWKKLRQWVNESRIALRIKRTIEEDAREWEQKGKVADYLLQGLKLTEAEGFLENYADSLPLSNLSQALIAASRAERDRQRRQAEERQQRETDLLKKALKAAQIRTIAVSLSAAIVLIAGGFVGWQQQQLQLAFYDIWSGVNQDDSRPTNAFSQVFYDIWLKINPNAFRSTGALNKLLEAAQNFKRNADKHGNEPDIQRAIAYYRQVRAEASKRLNTDHSDDRLPHEKSDLETLFKNTEAPLAELIEKYRLKPLQQELDQAKGSGQFGELLRRTPADLERQYSPGPLRTTYKILMGDLGVKADLNSDGRIINAIEANQIPCKTLERLERLWQETTKNRCSWYDRHTHSFDGNIHSPFSCKELIGRTLTERIFPVPQDSVVDRLKACKLVPDDLSL